MLNSFFITLKETFKNLEEKNFKIMKVGLIISFILILLGIAILLTYLFFIHTFFVYQLGLLIFELALSFAADFIISGIAVDSIKKQII